MQCTTALPRFAGYTSQPFLAGRILAQPARSCCCRRESEIRKTTDAELSILKWTDHTVRNPRTEDCKEIAKYDIVLTTFALASTLHTLRWVGGRCVGGRCVGGRWVGGQGSPCSVALPSLAAPAAQPAFCALTGLPADRPACWL